MAVLIRPVTEPVGLISPSAAIRQTARITLDDVV